MSATISRLLVPVLAAIVVTGIASGAAQPKQPSRIPNHKGIYTGCYAASTGTFG